MSIEQESGHENTPQKRERLQIDYIASLEELRSFYKADQKKSGEENSFESYCALDKLIKELKDKKDRLKEKLSGMEAELSGILKDDKSFTILEANIDSCRKEIAEVEEEITLLTEESTEIIEDETAPKKYYKGNELDLQLKWRNLNEIRRQIE